MEKIWVKEIKAGDMIDNYFAVSEMKLMPFKTEKRQGENYMRLKLFDASGQIEGKIWDSEAAEKYSMLLQKEDVIRVMARAEEFNGAVQLNINKLKVLEKENIDLSDFIPSLPLSVIEKKYQMLKHYIEMVQDPDLRGLLTLAADTYEEEIKKTPAGIHVHHNYGGGLLEHILEVLEIALLEARIQENYIHKDILIAGVILHDIGKVKEYATDKLTFQVDEKYLLYGGHIELGLDILRELADQMEGFPEETFLQLRHIILSHHGTPEWGSVEVPKTMEAIAVHYADLMSARLNQAKLIIDGKKEEEDWTEYNRLLGTRLYYSNRNLEK